MKTIVVTAGDIIDALVSGKHSYVIIESKQVYELVRESDKRGVKLEFWGNYGIDIGCNLVEN